MLRGNSPAKIDDKGRLKVPNGFRAVIQKDHGPELFVTSLTGQSVRIYPMPVWVDIERRLAQMPSTHPARLRFLDRVNFYGQVAELDPQGRVLIQPRLREQRADERRGRRAWPAELPRGLEPRAFRHAVDRRTVHRRGREGALRFRDLAVGATHVPVLLDEVRALLQPERGGTFVDCTVGLGGHARMLLDGGATRLIAIDRDPDALAVARTALAEFGDRVSFVHADYRELGAVLDAQGIGGRVGRCSPTSACRRCSSITTAAGSAFAATSRSTCGWIARPGETAAELIDRVDEHELADVIYQFGEERRSRQVARAIVMARSQAPIDDHRPAGGDCAARRGRTRMAADRSGDAYLPGASHLGQPRVGRPRLVYRIGCRPAAARRPAGRDCVSLARRPGRETHAARRSSSGEDAPT